MRRAGVTFLAAVCLWHAAAVCMQGDRAWCGVGGELAELEWLVAHAPENCELRGRLAGAYEERGLLEEAVAEYLGMLAREPGNEGARGGVEALVKERMPKWLPEEAEEGVLFALEVLEMELVEPEGTVVGVDRCRGARDVRRPELEGEILRFAQNDKIRAGVGTPGLQSGKKVEPIEYRLLVTKERFAAREGERWEEVHQRALPWVDYGYVWEAAAKRWVMRVRAHWAEAEDAELAQEALRATLAFYCVAREYLGCDPTERWAAPVEVWLGRRGRPGARAVGRNLYLYAVGTPRSPAEWVRQVAHEYGHIALPGIGGFTDTDDAWADGHLGELLFPKWLAAIGAPEWMPWSVAEWEREAQGERERLIAEAREAGLDAARLRGVDENAQDYFLGLALRVEEVAGPRFLGEVLGRCARGRAADFVGVTERLVEERGMEVWWTR